MGRATRRKTRRGNETRVSLPYTHARVAGARLDPHRPPRSPRSDAAISSLGYHFVRHPSPPSSRAPLLPVPIMDLEPLDPAYVADQLSRPPFVSIPGVVNVRDLGSYPADQPGFMTRPRQVYRSGELSYITPEGGSSPRSCASCRPQSVRLPCGPRNPAVEGCTRSLVSLRPPLRHRNA